MPDATERPWSMTRAERETTFRLADDEAVVFVWTAQPPVKRKLERAGHVPYRVSIVRGKEMGWSYRVPLAEFHWRVGARRRVSEAQRAAARRSLASRLTRISPSADGVRGIETPGPDPLPSPDGLGGEKPV